MKTVLINSENIILGFSTPQIDPVATNAKIKTELEKLSEQKIINKNSSLIRNYAVQNENEKYARENVFYLCASRTGKTDREMKLLLKVAPTEAKALLNASEIGSLEKFDNNILKLQEQGRALIESSTEEYKKIVAIKKNLIVEKAEYFGCGQGEIMISVSDFEMLRDERNNLDEGWSLKLIISEEGAISSEKIAPIVVESVPNS